MVKRSKKHSYSNLVQNDDHAEKRRRRSSIRQASDNRRTSLANVARDTFRRPGGSTESNVPLMANFEEWMKLVKDNKINQTNSWNFALIDYFHDMAVLKEGDGINFQKASYTLDGCVKIYTSRVDSVASETGKLLSGLADGGKELKNAQKENDENEEDEEDEEEKKRKQKRRKQRSEATLASSFEQLQVKNLDLELSVDPLFRKMCSDFNEGGAKGLLLNSLAIDNTGRVVFDGQMDQEPENENGDDEDTEKTRFSKRQIESIDLGLIKEGFFADLISVDNLSICPSLPVLQTALTDPDASEFMKDIENGNFDAANTIDNVNANIEFEGAFSGNIADFEDDDIPGDAELDDQDEPEMEFGVPDISMHQDDDDDEQQHIRDGLTPGDDNRDEDGILDEVDGLGAIAVLMNNVVGNKDSDIMAYFDETLRKNWAGPEHWRVQRIKNLQNPNGNTGPNNTVNSTTQTGTDGEHGENATQSAEPTKKRADKQAFFIDFLSNENDFDEGTLFAEGSASLNMPKTQQKSKTRNLLPDDEHFSSKSLIHLFLKPKAQIFRKSKSTTKDEDQFLVSAQKNGAEEDILVDENFFAENQQAETEPLLDDNMDDGDDGNIFGDDHGDDGNLDASQFNGTAVGAASASQGNLLLGNRKARPEYVNYAKTAKKVNIKLLKDNIWNVLDIPDDDDKDGSSTPKLVTTDGEATAESNEDPEAAMSKEKDQKVIKFSDMVQGLRDYYPPQQLSDISTSFCFISLLHLANEKGLIIEDNDDNTELSIRKDLTVSSSELSA